MTRELPPLPRAVDPAPLPRGVHVALGLGLGLLGGVVVLVSLVMLGLSGGDLGAGGVLVAGVLLVIGLLAIGAEVTTVVRAVRQRS